MTIDLDHDPNCRSLGSRACDCRDYVVGGWRPVVGGTSQTAKIHRTWCRHAHSANSYTLAELVAKYADELPRLRIQLGATWQLCRVCKPERRSIRAALALLTEAT